MNKSDAWYLPLQSTSSQVISPSIGLSENFLGSTDVVSATNKTYNFQIQTLFPLSNTSKDLISFLFFFFL